MANNYWGFVFNQGRYLIDYCLYLKLSLLIGQVIQICKIYLKFKANIT